MKKPVFTESPESAARAALRFMQAHHRAVNLNGSAYDLRDALKLAGQGRQRMCAEILLRALSESFVAHALSETPLPTAGEKDPRFAVYSHLLAELRASLPADSVADIIRRVTALSSSDHGVCADAQTEW